MKLRFGIVFALLAYASVAQAQFNGCSYGFCNPSKGTGPSFTGPGDAISGATAFYSCARAYTAAYASGAGNLCDIADVGTGATTCTMKASATGFADLTSALCAGGTQTVSAFCTAHTSCVVTRMYDQTAGNHCSAPTTSCDLVQATLANMPALTFSALNSLPCLTLTATKTMQTVDPFVLAQPFTYPLVFKQTTTGTNPNVLGDLGGNPGIFLPTAGNAVAIFAGSTLSATMTNNTFRGVQVVVSGASSTINVSGTNTNGNPGASNMSAQFVLGKSTGMIGVFCEGGIWPIAFSSGQQSTWFSNANGSSGYNGGL
jgi:hypothetical protein